MKSYNFEMGQTVKLSLTGESGTIIGRAEFKYSENSYYLRYVAADGRQVQQWHDESALETV